MFCRDPEKEVMVCAQLAPLHVLLRNLRPTLSSGVHAVRFTSHQSETESVQNDLNLSVQDFSESPDNSDNDNDEDEEEEESSADFSGDTIRVTEEHERQEQQQQNTTVSLDPNEDSLGQSSLCTGRDKYFRPSCSYNEVNLAMPEYHDDFENHLLGRCYERDKHELVVSPPSFGGLTHPDSIDSISFLLCGQGGSNPENKTQAHTALVIPPQDGIFQWSVDLKMKKHELAISVPAKWPHRDRDRTSERVLGDLRPFVALMPPDQ